MTCGGGLIIVVVCTERKYTKRGWDWQKGKVLLQLNTQNFTAETFLTFPNGNECFNLAQLLAISRSLQFTNFGLIEKVVKGSAFKSVLQTSAKFPFKTLRRNSLEHDESLQ